jgi:hypothetical protein
MLYPRQRARVSPTGRVTIRLTTAQRDLFLKAPDLPRGLGHELHRAAVRDGKLSLRVDRARLGVLITAAAATPASDSRSARSLETLLRYLESSEDRFEQAE